MSFAWRLALVVFVMAIIAWIDWRHHRAQATKWREYSFLLTAGLLGGLIAHCSTISRSRSLRSSFFSPEHCRRGGLPLSSDRVRFSCRTRRRHRGRRRYLIANNPKPGRPSLSYKRLFCLAVWPLAGALVAVPIVAPLICRRDPWGIETKLADLLTADQLNRFIAVWGINVGTYLGGVLGAIWGVMSIRRARAVMRASPHPAHSHPERERRIWPGKHRGFFTTFRMTIAQVTF